MFSRSVHCTASLFPLFSRFLLFLHVYIHLDNLHTQVGDSAVELLLGLGWWVSRIDLAHQVRRMHSQVISNHFDDSVLSPRPFEIRRHFGAGVGRLHILLQTLSSSLVEALSQESG